MAPLSVGSLIGILKVLTAETPQQQHAAKGFSNQLQHADLAHHGAASQLVETKSLCFVLLSFSPQCHRLHTPLLTAHQWEGLCVKWRQVALWCLPSCSYVLCSNFAQCYEVFPNITLTFPN